MKLVFKILSLALTIGIVSSCQSQSTGNYANELQDCLESSDIELLNSLSEKFEKHLINSYGSNLTESYKQYLGSVATGNFSQTFFKYSTFEEDMHEFRNSKFYQNSWVKTSSFDKEALIEVPLTAWNGEIQKQEVYDPIVLDPTGNYVSCLLNKNDSKAMNDYLEVVKTGIDISPGLVAKVLYDSLSTEELNDGLTRLIIAINFHYQIGLLITEKKN
ncbi:hypothetical protein [Pararhodonellum marinum]|uniref:hypothetical protein n=1 Tax=Pararhodonellum marinum TaxID=2755358 RepID=UPI00188E0197|nr:hypothetical protein [Pararhodonellum marinum]